MTDPRETTRSFDTNRPEQESFELNLTRDSALEGTDPETQSPRSRVPDLRFLAPAMQPGELGRLGGYRILEVLGEGGMGLVFRAEDPRLQREVAVKVVLPELAANPSASERFLREARMAARIKHDHVVTIYQVGQDRGVPFLALEFLKGESLDARLKREGRLPPFEVLRIGHEVARGLAAAHEQGLIHRDIKPANVWLEDPGERAKLLDFGLARAAKEDVQLTNSGAVVGTPAYMSPEQANGQPVDHRTDLFSLGVMLYRLATGQMPFPGDSLMAILSALAFTQPAPLGQLAPEAPQLLDEVVMRLLAKKPEERIQSAREVADLFAPATATVTVVSTPVPEQDYNREFDFGDDAVSVVEPEPPTNKHSRVPAVWLIGVTCGLIALLGLLGGGWLIHKAMKSPAPTEATGASGEAKAVTAPASRPKPTKVSALTTIDKAAQAGEVHDRLISANPKWSGGFEARVGEKYVKVDGAHLADLAPLAMLPWLEHLHVAVPLGGKPTSVSDLGPLRNATKLKSLRIDATRVSDLTPLVGLPLRLLSIERTDVATLAPLKGVTTLRHLNFSQTPVADVSPLAGHALTALDVSSSVRDWSPLRDTSLQSIRGLVLTPDAIRAAFPLHARFEFINDLPAPLFWGNATFKRTDFPALSKDWLERTAKLSGPDLRRAVEMELRERNREWDGELFGERAGPDGRPIEIGLYTSGLRDLTPLRAFTGLKVLRLNRLQTGTGPIVTDLEPLRGLKLVAFHSTGHTYLSLAPLREMPLRSIELAIDPETKWYETDLKAMHLETINGQQAADFWAVRK